MNQILFINDGKGNGTDIKKIIKFFAIVVIIFGLAMVGTGSYAMAQRSKEKNSIPDLSVQDLNNGNISIIVVHNKEIDSITYSWNNEETEEIGGAGRTEIEETIPAKGGTNILKVTAVDIEGKSNVFENQFTIVDNKKPELDLSIEGNKIVFTAIDETSLSYITYRWNDEEETKIEADEETEITEEIDIKEGTNTVTVVAVDGNNNMTELEQEIKGLSKPKVDAWKEEGQLILKITHEQGIGKIKVKYNGEELEYGPEKTNNSKEITLRFNLKIGDNHVDVWAYSTEDTEGLAPAEFLNGVATYNP
ncbi:MAG: hypothetical protein IKT41_05445 [Clostridia bacterium]|nr:hypothetical protein [Clostridia bacterium]